MHNLSKLTLAIWGTIAIAVASIPALAQRGTITTPCGSTSNNNQPSAAQGLTSVAGIIYDANQSVCWLADANLAGNSQVRAAVHLSPQNPDGSAPVINPDGTMNYQTALNWVTALNSYNGGTGWLNHNTWQLPTNPAVDPTCSSSNKDNFGAQCIGGAMGNLYGVGLARTYPDSTAPLFVNFVWPFFNLHPGLYWTSDTNPDATAGQITFSFNTGLHGSNTTKYNFLHVLPVTTSVLGPLPPGKGVNPYFFGRGAGRAVYDSNTGLSWTLDANLPALETFGFKATTTVTADNAMDPNPPTNGGTLTLPMINHDGTIYFDAVNPKSTTPGWISAMNAAKYAGSSSWALPSEKQIAQLYADMGIGVGDSRLEWPFPTGPFTRLQPGFYWGCARTDGTGSSGTCDLTQNAPPDPQYAGNMEWSFNFDDGFEGTDQDNKMFYVMVYYPIQGCGEFC